ncbi:MAG: hypothetical protein J5790_03935 [Bacteroidaceae bacterium]|nr:hypothetical protein [Bacteroidaceae bacterium]
MRLKLLLGFALSLIVVTGAKAQDVETGLNYTVTKISNPDRGEREVDGLVPGGDRENSYTWRMAMRGDEIYIATARNIASALVNMYGSQISAASGMSMDTFWALIDAFANGDIMRNDVNEGANIIAYNRKTGEFRVVWTGGPGEYQRMAVTFGDNVYFGSYSADQSIEQYILKLDKEGNFTKVYTTTGTTAMRANCVYDDHLFFASSDARTVVAEGDPEPLAKMAVIRKSNEDDTVWDLVADYKDFGKIPFDPIQASWAGCSFWELASHKGYIYATAPSTAGFVIFKGRPAQDGESANEYGWHWEEVAGPNNGINNPGLSNVTGGEPGTMRSLIGSVYEFNGELYAYNFDHAFGGLAQAFVGALQQLKGSDVKSSNYLEYMYNSLHNPQKVWKLNDATGKFVECRNFTKLMEGTTNEYVWRMGEYDGQLYISTMDAGIGYGYLTQLTNGSLLKMSKEEKATKIAYVSEAIKLLAAQKLSTKAEDLKTKLALVKMMLEAMIPSQADEDGQGKQIDLEKLQATITAVKTLVDIYLATLPGEDLSSKAILVVMTKVKETLQDLSDKIDLVGLEKYLYVNNRVKNDQWGFDLYRTSDGETFEVITQNGFNDKYNYGCPSFLATEEGLYIGTCNPFYGGQLYLLTNNTSETEMEKEVSKISQADVATDITTIYDADDANIYYDLNGHRLQGKPTQKGVYICNGMKVVVQ